MSRDFPELVRKRKIEVPNPAGGVWDLTERDDRQAALRWLVSILPEYLHAWDLTGPFHAAQFDPEALRLVYFKGRVRLDGWCAGCDPSANFGPTFCHQDSLLPYVKGRYVGANDIAELDPKPRLPDGARRAVAKALQIIITARLAHPEKS